MKGQDVVWVVLNNPDLVETFRIDDISEDCGGLREFLFLMHALLFLLENCFRNTQKHHWWYCTITFPAKFLTITHLKGFSI